MIFRPLRDEISSLSFAYPSQNAAPLTSKKQAPRASARFGPLKLTSQYSKTPSLRHSISPLKNPVNSLNFGYSRLSSPAVSGILQPGVPRFYRLVQGFTAWYRLFRDKKYNFLSCPKIIRKPHAAVKASQSQSNPKQSRIVASSPITPPHHLPHPPSPIPHPVSCIPHLHPNLHLDDKRVFKELMAHPTTQRI